MDILLYIAILHFTFAGMLGSFESHLIISDCFLNPLNVLECAKCSKIPFFLPFKLRSHVLYFSRVEWKIDKLESTRFVLLNTKKLPKGIASKVKWWQCAFFITCFKCGLHYWFWFVNVQAFKITSSNCHVILNKQWKNINWEVAGRCYRHVNLNASAPACHWPIFISRYCCSTTINGNETASHRYVSFDIGMKLYCASYENHNFIFQGLYHEMFLNQDTQIQTMWPNAPSVVCCPINSALHEQFTYIYQ